MFGISFTVKVGVTGMRGWVGGSVERIEAITEKGHYEMPADNACLQKKRANKILMVAQPMNGRFASDQYTVTTSQLIRPKMEAALGWLCISLFDCILPENVRLKQLRVSSSNDAFPPESRTRATHREALIQIKQSLQPYHNSNASPSSVHQNVCTSANSQSTVVQSTPTKTTPSTSAKSDIATVSLQESAMLDYLVNMGFDKDAAWYALKLTRFRSMNHAVDILLKTNSPHVFRADKDYLSKKYRYESLPGDQIDECSNGAVHRGLTFGHHHSTPPPTYDQRNTPAQFMSQATSKNVHNNSQAKFSAADFDFSQIIRNTAAQYFNLLQHNCRAETYAMSDQLGLNAQHQRISTTTAAADNDNDNNNNSAPFQKCKICNHATESICTQKAFSPELFSNNELIRLKKCQIQSATKDQTTTRVNLKPAVERTGEFLEMRYRKNTPLNIHKSRLHLAEHRSTATNHNEDYKRRNNCIYTVEDSGKNMPNIQNRFDEMCKTHVQYKDNSKSLSDPYYIENLCRRVNDVLCQAKVDQPNRREEPYAQYQSTTFNKPYTSIKPLAEEPPPPPPDYASSIPSSSSSSLVNNRCRDQQAEQQRAVQNEYTTVIRSTSPLPDLTDKQIQDIIITPENSRVIRPCTPQAFRFYMEQHVENVLKMYKERVNRQMQLEKEMVRANFSSKLQCQLRKLLTQKESWYLRLKRQKMNSSMFEKIKIIGVGAFGEVTLVRKKDTNTLFAMKVLRKLDVIKRNQAAHVKAERDILSKADNEWVVKLYYSFQDKDSLFFIMEYIPGGDMMALLIKKGIFEESLARFYIAELVCAIQSVHKLGFIHRDIKPDNILIDRNGHIKLTDFGLCTGLRWTHDWKYYAEEPTIPGHSHQDSFDLLKQQEPHSQYKVLHYRNQKKRCQAHSLVGTPNYIAPEVLLRTGHTQLCDWWSVGVILFEMVVGHPPFLANTSEETQAKVIDWRNSLQIPPEAKLSAVAKDLIVKLCCSQEYRLGKENDAQDIKSHPFFEGINWNNLRKTKAPYRPQLLGDTDTSNFDPVEPRPQSSNSEMSPNVSDHAFYEFTFRRFFDSDGYGCPTLRPNKSKKLLLSYNAKPNVNILKVNPTEMEENSTNMVKKPNETKSAASHTVDTCANNTNKSPGENKTLHHLPSSPGDANILRISMIQSENGEISVQNSNGQQLQIEAQKPSTSPVNSSSKTDKKTHQIHFL
ncbi:Serine/threonine-protein kinase LATS1 [Trichinella spiralis]|uniref:non-specific serine/threonine protein kinase n=1 Tax=Trichinella spiralis TaxID=6334 RepID=A0A0V1B9P6_TRISP|nr:Serine/threonine-protein kinase LATS1 [Trichinella spiralis]